MFCVCCRRCFAGFQAAGVLLFAFVVADPIYYFWPQVFLLQ